MKNIGISIGLKKHYFLNFISIAHALNISWSWLHFNSCGVFEMVSTPARISMNSSDICIAKKYGHSRALYFFLFFNISSSSSNDSSTIFPFFLSTQSTVCIGSRISMHTRSRIFYTFAIINYCSNFVSF